MADNPTVEKWTRQYIALRDALKKLDEDHNNVRKEYVSAMEQLSGRLQKFLEDSAVESARTSSGTIYTSTRYTASLTDPEAFMRFVIDNKQFDLIERRANSTAVKDYVKEHNNLPPGANLTALKTVGVRRAGAKASGEN